MDLEIVEEGCGDLEIGEGGLIEDFDFYWWMV
jgi:hypothetical protein